MSRLGTYKNKNVHDYGNITTAINASIDNDLFSVYWYKKVMSELNNQWLKIRPTFGTEKQ